MPQWLLQHFPSKDRVFLLKTTLVSLIAGGCVLNAVEIHIDMEILRVSEPICMSRWVYLQRFSFSTVYLPFHLPLSIWRVSDNAYRIPRTKGTL